MLYFFADHQNKGKNQSSNINIYSLFIIAYQSTVSKALKQYKTLIR